MSAAENTRQASNWRDVGLDARQAAQRLHEAHHDRSAVSRAYYAAYSIVTGTLISRGVHVAGRHDNPGHQQLESLLGRASAEFPRNSNAFYDARRRLANLRKARIEADYRPGATIGSSESRQAMRDLSRLVASLDN